MRDIWQFLNEFDDSSRAGLFIYTVKATPNVLKLLFCTSDFAQIEWFCIVAALKLIRLPEVLFLLVGHEKTVFIYLFPALFLDRWCLWASASILYLVSLCPRPRYVQILSSSHLHVHPETNKWPSCMNLLSSYWIKSYNWGFQTLKEIFQAPVKATLMLIFNVFGFFCVWVFIFLTALTVWMEAPGLSDCISMLTY